MTLMDTDKSSDNRAKPSLNASDGLNVESVKAHATESIAYRSEDATNAPRVISKDDQIIVHDGTANKALFGRDGLGNYVFKVAKDGFNVLTAADNELIFNSEQDIFKIVSTTTAVIPSSTTSSTNSSSSVTVNHNLNFTPICWAFAVDPALGSLTALPMAPDIRMLQRNTASPNNGFTVEFMSWVRVITDSTTVTFYADFANLNYPSSYTFNALTIKYYLLQETAT